MRVPCTMYTVLHTYMYMTQTNYVIYNQYILPHPILVCSPPPSPGGSGQPTVLNIDHYLLQLNSKLDTVVISLETLKYKLEQLNANLLEHKQDTSAEQAQLQSSLTNTQSSLETHTQQVNTKLSLLTTSLSEHKGETATELA